MSMAEFGSKLDVSRDVINNLERGRVNIQPHMIKLICMTFGVSEAWLNGDNVPMYEPAPVDLIAQLAAEHNLGPGGQALLRVALRIFDELGPDALERVITDTIPAIMAERNIESPTEAAARKSSPRASDEEAN